MSRRVRMALMSTLLTSALMTESVPAWGWGSLGHRIVAETAALLVQDRQPASWGSLLARHRFALGYYAFVPDFMFRYKDEGGKRESPTHFMDIDLLPASARKDLPLSYSEARKRLAPLLIGNRKATFEEVGSCPWRVEQFVRLARERFKGVARVEGGYQPGKAGSDDTRKVYRALVLLGLMAHYSGDAAMPYHASADWNGQSTGQGGVHFFFETDCVNELEPGLSEAVLLEARKRGKSWLGLWRASERNPVELIGTLMEDSLATVPKVSRIDLAQAVTRASPANSEKPAERRPVAQACRAFRSLLVERLAKGAVMTSWLWSSVLPENVEFRGSLQFSDLEAELEFIPPDYY